MKIHSSGSTRSSGGDKRERILDAAEQVFAESGFFNARVSAIAKSAGVADGTIYLYFKSKDDVLISLFESRMERVNQSMAAVAAAESSPRAKLTAMVRHHLEMVRDHPQLAEILTIELRQSSKFMKEYANPRFGEFLKLMAQEVDKGQQTGEFSDAIPAAMVARMIFGILDELALAWLLGRGENFDIERAADWVVTLVMNGLVSRSAAAGENGAVGPSGPETQGAAKT